MLDKAWADSQIPAVILMLKGSPVSFVERSGSMTYSGPFAVDATSLQRYNLNVYDYRTGRMVPNPNIPPNSVGVLPITGPITKYNGDCGEPGSIERTNWALTLMQRDNIGSIIQLIDTPGGESRAASGYVSVLKNSKKPVLSFIDGMCASLGVWFSSVSQEAFFGNEMDEMGSVGSYCSILDFRGYLEKEGINLIEIYAPQSTEKNKEYRDALNGDTSAIEADLKMHVDHFISFVKNSRGDKAKANASAWEKGAMFHAREAVKIGLADGIKPFSEVVSKAAWLAKRNK